MLDTTRRTLLVRASDQSECNDAMSRLISRARVSGRLALSYVRFGFDVADEHHVRHSPLYAYAARSSVVFCAHFADTSLRRRQPTTPTAQSSAESPPSAKGMRGEECWMTQPMIIAPTGVLPKSAIW